MGFSPRYLTFQTKMIPGYQPTVLPSKKPNVCTSSSLPRRDKLTFIQTFHGTGALVLITRWRKSQEDHLNIINDNNWNYQWKYQGKGQELMFWVVNRGITLLGFLNPSKSSSKIKITIIQRAGKRCLMNEEKWWHELTSWENSKSKKKKNNNPPPERKQINLLIS